MPNPFVWPYVDFFKAGLYKVSRLHDHLVCHAGSLERKVGVKSIIQYEYNL